HSWKLNASTPSPPRSRTWTVAASSSGGIFDFDARQSRLAEVSRELEDPGVWNDAKRAQELGREKKQLDAVVEGLAALHRRIADAQELFELARAEGDDETLVSVESEVAAAGRTVADFEFRRMFS